MQKYFLLHLDVAEHLDEIVGTAAEGEVIQYVLIHELDVGISQSYRAIDVPGTNKRNIKLHETFVRENYTHIANNERE